HIPWVDRPPRRRRARPEVDGAIYPRSTEGYSGWAAMSSAARLETFADTVGSSTYRALEGEPSAAVPAWVWVSTVWMRSAISSISAVPTPRVVSAGVP